MRKPSKPLAPAGRSWNKTKPLELTLHKAVVQALQEHCYPYWCWFHVPNGAPTNAITGARFKAMGLKPGIPDLVLVAPDNTVRFLELKREGGKLSEAQLDFQVFCIAHGHQHAVVDNLRDALAVLSNWNCLRVKL